MKNLILENDCEQDIPKELQEILKHKFKEGREIWSQFKSAYWPENRKTTLERLLRLTEEDNLVCQTVFVDWQQLEILAEVLYGFMQKGKKINFYLMVTPGLNYHIKKYLNACESNITPNTKKYDDNPKLRKEFKSEMNTKVLEVLDYHNIYDMSRFCQYEDGFEEGCTKVTSDTVKNFNEEW